MPTARGFASVATLNGKIYVIGGTNNYDSQLSAVEAYNPATNSWEQLAPLPVPIQRAAAAASGGKIYLINGNQPGTDGTSNLLVYDPATNTWQSRTAPPVSTIGSSAVATPDGTIYLFGGYPGCCGGYLNAVYQYNLTTDTWTSRASMPSSREGSAAVLAANGKIYVEGGNGSSDVWRVMEEYDPVTNTWASRSQAPLAQSYGSIVAGSDGILYLFGALGTTSQVQQYDPATDTWAIVTTLPTARDLLVAANPGNGKMYVLGGRDPSSAHPFVWLNTNEALSFAGPTFTFGGFQSPINNLPTINTMKAGAAVPVKFSLGGDQGLDIFNSGYPASQQYNCSSSDPIDAIEQTVTAGASGLQYDATTDTYTYVWKTNKAWKGTCRALILNFTDGSTQVAKFQFH